MIKAVIYTFIVVIGFLAFVTGSQSKFWNSKAPQNPPYNEFQAGQPGNVNTYENNSPENNVYGDNNQTLNIPSIPVNNNEPNFIPNPNPNPNPDFYPNPNPNPNYYPTSNPTPSPNSGFYPNPNPNPNYYPTPNSTPSPNSGFYPNPNPGIYPQGAQVQYQNYQTPQRQVNLEKDKYNCMGYFYSDDTITAEKCFRSALKQDNYNLKYHFYLAQIMYDKRDYVAAAYHSAFVKDNGNLNAPSKYITGSEQILNKSIEKLHKNLSIFDSENIYLGHMKRFWFWDKRRFNVWIEPKPDIAINPVMAFKTWEKALDNFVRFNFVQDESSADISVYFDTQKAQMMCINVELRSPNEKIGGCTKLESPNNILKKVPIYISTYGNLEENRKNSGNMYISLMHEIGHALGLDSHSPNKNDLMYYSSTKTYPSQRDINTVKKLFSR